MSGKSRGVRRRTASVLLLTALVVVITLAWTGTALADRWTDISDQQWINSYGVTATQAATVADGYSDGTFKPTRAVTRGQFAKMVVDGFGVAPANPPTATFGDVARGSTFYTWIEGGVAAGLISGFGDGTYKPNSNISRQQSNSILGSYLSKRELSTTGSITGRNGTYTSLNAWYATEGTTILAQFSDGASVATVHRQYTAYLVMRDIVKGSNGKLTPGTNLNRAQAVALILRTKAATFGSTYTADMSVALMSPSAGGGNSISVSGAGGTRTVSVNVVGGTSYVVLLANKTAAQALTVGGANAADVTAGGTSTAATYTINMSSVVGSGGAKVFTLTLSEAGKTSIVYNVTVALPSGFNLALTSPAPSTYNTLSITPSGSGWGVNVTVVNGTNSVVLTGTKTAAQTVTLGGADASKVVIGGTITAPTYTVNTSSIAAAGGSMVFALTVSESGKTDVVYTVTITVTPTFSLALSTPPPSVQNTLAITGSGTTWNAAVNVVSGTSGVVLTATKSPAQTVTLGGTDAALVTVSGSTNAPAYTVNTSTIATGGTKVFNLTVSESGKADVVYTVTITVKPLTTEMPLTLTTPAPGTYNSIAVSGTGATRTVDVKAANGTTTVVLSGIKTANQTVTVGGADSANVAAAGTATAPTFTVNTSSLAEIGGKREFTLTVSEPGKTNIEYAVTVTVAGLTANLNLTLTTPAPSANNAIATTGAGASKTVSVNVENGTSTVVINGTKTAAQTVVKGGTDASLVTLGGTTTALTLTVDTSTVSAAGGSKVFTLTVTEAGKGTVTYTVTVTVLGIIVDPMTLELTTPAPGVGNTIDVTGTGTARTVEVEVVNGTTSVVLTGVKTAAQTVTKGGTNASLVTIAGSTTVPTFTVNTSSKSAGGTLTFTLTLSQPGKTSIVYTVTLTVSGRTEPMELALTTPPDNDAGNNITVTGTGATRTVAVVVENGYATVVLTGTKTAAQTVTIGGANAGDVSAAGTDTAPTFSVNTLPIKDSGGTRTFTLTLSETGQGSIVYSVTVTVAAPYATFSSLDLTTPAPNAYNTIALSGSGAARTVAVNVENNISSVVLTGTKTAAQTVTKAGANAGLVTVGGTTTAPIYTINTTSVAAAGGSLTFTLTVAETGKVSVVYTVTITVAGRTTALTSLVLFSPSPDASNSLSVAGSGGARTVAVNVQNGTNSVVMNASKASTQTLVDDSASVSVSASATDPVITVTTTSIAAGGSMTFHLTLSETGKGSIVYTVTVTVAGGYTADIGLVLTTPSPSADNTLVGPYDTSASTRAADASVVNGTASVVLTGTKTTAQTVTKGGTDAAKVTITGGSTTNPAFTVNTSTISAGGSLVFTITVSETGKTSKVYTVTVTVAGLTEALTSLELTTPPDNDADNDISVTGTGGARTVLVDVENGIGSVVLTANKAVADPTEQLITISGPNAGDVTQNNGAADTPTFTIDTDSIKAAGGSKVFTLTLNETGKASIAYAVTVAVAMKPMTLALTTPTPGALNTIADVPDTPTTRTVTVNVVNGINSVVLTGAKAAVQTLTKGGTHASYVTIAGEGTTNPTFTVNTSTIAAPGGEFEFTITLTEAGKGSIVYNVTLTVAGRTDPFGSLVLHTPAPGGGNSINTTGSGGTRTVAVVVVNGTASVRLDATKTAAQTLAISGANAADVSIGGTAVAPRFTIDTDSIKAAGGSKVFTITLGEEGLGSIAYAVTVTVAAP
ncbi:MAG: S-layer homology domain-containing protein [Thermoleophilia bacterium]|nr:S-layer homology domain-containing protein [Thermoleophilia bacterium]